MITGDFGSFPQPGESAEQHEHRVQEALLGENWLARFQANGAAYRALGVELDIEEDPEKIVELIERRGESLVRGLGSCAISLWKRDVLAEREAFNEQFGQDNGPEQQQS